MIISIPAIQPLPCVTLHTPCDRILNPRNSDHQPVSSSPLYSTVPSRTHLRKHPHLDLILPMIHRIGDPEIGSSIDDPGDEALRAGDIKPLFGCQRQGEWEEHVHLGVRGLGWWLWSVRRVEIVDQNFLGQRPC
jgi:hypothetical protein